MDALLPHDLPHARRVAAAVSISSAFVLLAFTLRGPGHPPYLAAHVATVVLVAAIGVCVLRVPDRAAAVLCLVTPLVGVATIVVLDLLTADASVAAQVFLCLPVLFAATQLAGSGAYVVLGAAVAGEGVVTWTLMAPARAVADFAYLSVVMILITVVLVHAGKRQRRLVDALRQQAAIDPLTGLVTRRVLDDALGASLSSAGGACGTSLLLVDVDHFKRVNDTYGHPVGDDVLEAVGRVLKSASRPTDVIARMGGDELALLLTSCPYDQALQRAENILELVRSMAVPLPHGQTVDLTVSVGVAHAPTHASDVRALYAAADEALYRAKRGGRDRVGGCDPAESTLDAHART